MHPDTKAQMVGVIHGLLDKTRTGRIEWSETDKEGVYQTATDTTSLQIGRETSSISSNDDYYSESVYLEILGPSGQSIETIAATDGHGEYFQKELFDLHEFARTNALDLDKILDNLLSVLEAEPVSDPSAPPPVARAYSTDEEPF